MDWLIWVIMAAILLIAVVTDLKSRIIPNKLLIAGCIVLLPVHLVLHPDEIWAYFMAASVWLLGMWTLAILANGRIGGGDVKLFALLGFAVGMDLTLWTFIFAHLVAGMAVLVLWIRRRFKTGDSLAFAPYTMAGFALTGLLIFNS
ncbi:prepilin peptidase [Effusibacillus lacus]|nr:prepilin peptidase [Effusibacillus lacus]TCS71263.1 leader peptidase (prepilin peptidase)/N-methyltransferase [Effusibacillus lacus]